MLFLGRFQTAAYFGNMPAADYQLFGVNIRPWPQDDMTAAIAVALDPIDATDGDQCAAVDPNEAVTELFLEGLQGIVDEVRNNFV